MAEEGTTMVVGEERADDILDISDEDFEAILASETGSVEEAVEEETEQGDGAALRGEIVRDAESVSGVTDAIKTGMAEVLGAVKSASEDSKPTPAPGDGMAALRDHVTKQIMTSQGLSEEGARFMTESVMAGIQPVVQVFQRQIQQLNGTITNLRSENTLGDLDRKISGWLDGHRITDEGEREDIADIAKFRAHRLKGNDVKEADIRSEITKLANRSVKTSVSMDKKETRETNDRARKTPPPGGDGLSGQDDLISKVNASTSSRDTIGGDRFQRLAASLISGGGGR